MCGIVGYVGGRPCKELLLSGLERLEYRGYDSAGICLINGRADITRRVGKVSALRDAVGTKSADLLCVAIVVVSLKSAKPPCGGEF